MLAEHARHVRDKCRLEEPDHLSHGQRPAVHRGGLPWSRITAHFAASGVLALVRPIEELGIPTSIQGVEDCGATRSGVEAGAPGFAGCCRIGAAIE